MFMASKAYRQQIEKIPFRNRSYMRVSIGAINQLAQENATITSETSYLSNNTWLFNGYIPQVRYATYEQNWWTADGTMRFPQPSASADYIYNQGAISLSTIAGTDKAIMIEFDTLYDIKGLTITFHKNCYPTSFSVTNGSVTYTYNNDTYAFTTSDIYDGTGYLLITPITMLGGEQRLHIEQMYMGVGLTFENSEIMSVEKNEYVSPISESLPTMDIKVEIQNYDGQWDFNNSSSSINYLETGQQITLEYGYDLDDGSRYWMYGGVGFLTTWSADDSKMSFESTDVFATLTETYYGGTFYQNGRTAYNLAVDVLNDAGVDPRYYVLDEYLKNVIIYNPLPAVSHAECLQLIANASRARLRTDRMTGYIIMEFAAEMEIAPERMGIETNSTAPFSDLEAVIQGKGEQDYAMYTLNYWTADGTMLFVPENENYVTTGYISDAIAIKDTLYPAITMYPSESINPTTEDTEGVGTFDVNPTVTITLEASYVFYNIGINFLSNPPTKMILHSYLNGELKESFLVTEIELDNVIDHDFPELDRLVIEFTEAPVYNRIYLASVQFGQQTNFTFSKGNTTAYPVCSVDEKIKELQVIKTAYSEGEEFQQIVSDTVDLTDADTYTFYLSQASHGFVGVADGTTRLTITKSSAYSVTFNTSSLTGQHEIAVNGYTYDTTQTIYHYPINTTGVVQQWENPLISENTIAGLVGEWVGNYLLNNATYDVEYRGEPRLDAGDLAYLENDYVDAMMVRIENHGVSFNGALSGSAVCRLTRGTH